MELNCEPLWIEFFGSTKSLNNGSEIVFSFQNVWIEPLCGFYSVLWWHTLNAILSAYSGPRLASIQAFHKSKFSKWKEIACDWHFFCFLQTMVYQGEVRAFHQNLYMTLPFSPFLTSSLHLTHTPSLWKRLFCFQSCSVSTRHDHVKCTSCTVSLHPFTLPPPCNHLGHNVWSSNCYLAVRGECWENFRMLTRIKMLTKLGNLLSCDLYEIFIWFYHSNLVSCIRRHPKGPIITNLTFFALFKNFFPVLHRREGQQRGWFPAHRLQISPVCILLPSSQSNEVLSWLQWARKAENLVRIKNHFPKHLHCPTLACVTKKWHTVSVTATSHWLASNCLFFMNSVKFLVL